MSDKMNYCIDCVSYFLDKEKNRYFCADKKTRIEDVPCEFFEQRCDEDIDNPWHTGTPTEEGWYLIKYICIHEGKYKGSIWYSTLRIEIHEDGYIETSGGIGNDDVWKPVEYLRIGDVWKPIERQKIEPYEEKEDGKCSH